MNKRFLSVFLSICMIIPAFSGMSAYAVGEEAEAALSASDPMSQVPAENAYEKIHFYFDTAEYATLESVSELASATASVKTDYAATLGVAQRRETDSNVDENVYITVQFVSDYMEDETYKTLKAARENAKTADERDEAKTNMNRYSKQYHADLVAENLPTLSAIPYTDFHAIDYSSFVTLTVPAASLDTEVLEEVADQDNILHISLTDGFEVADCSETSSNEETYLTAWTDVMDCINATDILEETDANGNLLHTGEGVKVGVYEHKDTTLFANYTYANSCDTHHINLSSLSLSVRAEGLRINDPYRLTHGTKVMSVLAKIIPDAQYYYANVLSTSVTGSGWIEGLEWFISQNCDVVNCSFGYQGSGAAYRFDIDAVYDYQIYTSDIIVVVSSGNADTAVQDEIESPAKARNVITVSGVEATSSGEWIFADEAIYEAESSYIINPTVAAPYYMHVDNIDNMLRGTSFAAPLVTACVALLFENLAGSPIPSFLVRSLVMASANRTSDYEMYTASKTADRRVGAGIIDLERLLSSTDIVPIYISETAAAYTEFYSKSIYLTAGTEICVALNWNIDIDPVAVGENNSGTVYAPDIDLRLYNESGYVVSRSTYSDYSSTEYIRYRVASSGYYRIVLYNYETYPVTLEYGLAYSKQ